VAGFVGDTSLFKGWITKNSDGAHLRTENGVNVLLEDGPHVEGSEATAFVRPEWISLLAKQQLPRADMPVGTVERVMFFGSSRDYLVRHAGTLMRVKSSNSPLEFDVGDEVGLDFRVRVLPGNPS
jgi:ABC-type Fe3+/spermidine/putrescine transport system ATPase subunit